MSLIYHLVSSSLSLWRGTQVRRSSKGKPLQALHLYDIESFAPCRLVREVLTELDLDVIIYPCPKGGQRFRSRMLTLGGREQFPYLVDPNTGRSLYQSTDIIAYLFLQYGDGQVPRQWRWMRINKASSLLGTVSRLGAGNYARPSKRPELLLELYSFESSPYARPVRERLCELELPYVLRNLGKGHWEDYLLPGIRKHFHQGYVPRTDNRRKLLAETGRVASPYLVDPNTRVSLFESRDILAYLDRQYAV
jgi:glutathione S-transferase